MDQKKKLVNESATAYQTQLKTKSITFFNSLNEMEDFDRLKMAKMTAAERLEKLEQMRKFFYKEYLNPDGTWPPLDRVIRIIYKSE
jgi:hypothetical protein